MCRPWAVSKPPNYVVILTILEHSPATKPVYGLILTQKSAIFDLAHNLSLSYTAAHMKPIVQLFIVSGFAISSAFQLAGCASEEEPEVVTEEQEQAMEEEEALEE